MVALTRLEVSTGPAAPVRVSGGVLVGGSVGCGAFLVPDLAEPARDPPHGLTVVFGDPKEHRLQVFLGLEVLRISVVKHACLEIRRKKRICPNDLPRRSAHRFAVSTASG